MSCLPGWDPSTPAGRAETGGGGGETRSTRPLLQDTLQAHGKGACQTNPFGQPVIGRFMSFLVMCNSTTTALSVSVSRLPPSPPTTIPILRPCNQQARRPGCGPAGGANTTPRGMDGTATTSNNESFVRSLARKKQNATSDGILKKKTIEPHLSPCRSGHRSAKNSLPSPSNTASAQGPEQQLLAGVLQCSGSTSHDSVIGHSPWKGCIQGTEHASSAAGARPPASCALRPPATACDRRVVVADLSRFGVVGWVVVFFFFFWRGAFISGVFIGWLGQ